MAGTDATVATTPAGGNGIVALGEPEEATPPAGVVTTATETVGGIAAAFGELVEATPADGAAAAVDFFVIIHIMAKTPTIAAAIANGRIGTCAAGI